VWWYPHSMIRLWSEVAPAAAPMLAVMAVAPDRGDVAAGVLAMPVADHYRAAQPARHHPGSPPDIERLGRGVGDDPMHGGVVADNALTAI
jgi:hypothetical protein